MMSKFHSYRFIDIEPDQMASLKSLPNRGVAKKLDSGYIFAKVDDQIVEIGCDILKKQLRRPSLGAHITVAYETEINAREINFLEPIHVYFNIERIGELVLDGTRYYAVVVSSPDIKEIRLANGMTEYPCYKGISLPYHITIGKNMC